MSVHRQHNLPDRMAGLDPAVRFGHVTPREHLGLRADEHPGIEQVGHAIEDLPLALWLDAPAAAA